MQRARTRKETLEMLHKTHWTWMDRWTRWHEARLKVVKEGGRGRFEMHAWIFSPLSLVQVAGRRSLGHRVRCIEFYRELEDSRSQNVLKILQVLGEDAMGVTEIKDRFKGGSTSAESEQGPKLLEVQIMSRGRLQIVV